jgi:tRNA G18 (ribose-2'-O)-methylase SpoU
MDEERIPFQVTLGAEPYDELQQLPVVVLLENLRSAYNVGSFFRTADAAGVERLLLCGITATPPHEGIAKTALGAEQTVPWEYTSDAVWLARDIRARGYEIAVVETRLHAVDLFDWMPRFPVCLVFGNELSGVSDELCAAADLYVRIPMLGAKHSLNVATAGGVVIYELLRKYRQLWRSAHLLPR